MLRQTLLAVCLSAGLAAPGAAAQAAPACQLVLGFANLASMIPLQVGGCVDDESHNPGNGDALQHTSTGGLLVWRKADNWTAFTNGFHTWINGPNGLQERLNTERFPWEAPAPPPPSASPSSAAVVVPAGYPPMSQLPSDQQLGCVHMAEDLKKAATQSVHMQGDDGLCPYGQDPMWPGFA